MDYSIGTSVLENWKIVRFLGEGANGKVFEIHKTDHGVTAKSALKVIRVPRSEADIRAALSEGMDQQSVTTYFQGIVDEIVKEIALMGELKSHPAIVSCEDYQVVDHPGEIGWDILIRMELLTALPDYQMNSPLGEADVLRMGREVCSALVLCQKKGLIHRDVKPENIFVSEFGQFKLGDFGVARTVEKTTGGLSKKGTESYMAPEVYLGRPYGGSVDIYSLGLVLYKFLNKGRLPFFPAWPSPITFADRENALSARMQGKEFPHPCDACDSFADVIRKACAYDPKERYHTAAEFLEALNQVELPQNAGKSAAAGSFAGTSEIHADEEKTMGMYGSSGAEDKTVGMYGSSDAEDKTLGMPGDSTVNSFASKESAHQPSQPPELEKTAKKTRKFLPLIVAAAAVIGLIAIMVFVQSNKTYQVTVANGSGAGAYKAGDEVTLTAEDRSAEDLAFAGWEVTEEGVELSDVSLETCTFSMPKTNVEVAAQYTPNKHYLKVIGGEGEGEYIAGDEVTVQAVNDAKDQQVFAGWEVTKGEVTLTDASSETCSFIMPQSDVEIKCKFENIYQVTVSDGDGGGTYKAGDEVIITAEDRSADDMVFAGWEVTKGEVTLSDVSSETCSFVMPQSDVKIGAVFKHTYQVTVTDGSGSGVYKEGDVVTLTAKDRSAEDLIFYAWSIDKGGVILSDITARDCQFTMRNSDVEISAVYKEKLQIEWENVIDRLMEPEAWMSIDGRTNYAEFSEEDWDTYQANYNLAVGEEVNSLRNTMPVLPLKEYADIEDDHNRLRFYDIIDENVEDYYGSIYFNSYDDSVSIDFDSHIWWKAMENDPDHWKKGLYPNFGGIYLGDRYEDVMEQLGITDEMLDWIAQDGEDISMQYFGNYRVSISSGIFTEDNGQIWLEKDSKEIRMLFLNREDLPFLQYYALEGLELSYAR